MHKTLLTTFFALCLTAAAHSQENRDDNSDVPLVVRPILAINEFFDTRLPGTLDKFDLTLEYRPRFSDFIRREFIRFPFVLRYGVTDDLEAGVLATPFIPNPAKSGDDQRWGVGEAGVFARANINPIFGLWDQAMIEVSLRQPIGRPPIDLIDGYTRIRPILAVSRAFIDPETTVLFANLSYDHALGHWGRTQPHLDWVTRRDIAEAGPGILYKPTEFGYFAEYRLRHIDEPLEYRWAHVYRVGIVWEVPRHRSEALRLPGLWQIEAGYRLTDEQRRSLAHAITMRVRWIGDLKAVFRGERSEIRASENGNDVDQFIPR